MATRIWIQTFWPSLWHYEGTWHVRYPSALWRKGTFLCSSLVKSKPNSRITKFEAKNGTKRRFSFHIFTFSSRKLKHASYNPTIFQLQKTKVPVTDLSAGGNVGSGIGHDTQCLEGKQTQLSRTHWGLKQTRLTVTQWVAVTWWITLTQYMTVTWWICEWQWHSGWQWHDG